MIPMLVTGGLAAYNAYQGSKNQKQAQQAQQAALNFEREKWDAGGAFRDQGQQLLGRTLNPQAITDAFADPGNPYAAGNAYQSPWTESATPPRSGVPRATEIRRAADDLDMRKSGKGWAMATDLLRQQAAGMEGGGLPDSRARLSAVASMMPRGRR